MFIILGGWRRREYEKGVCVTKIVMERMYDFDERGDWSEICLMSRYTGF